MKRKPWIGIGAIVLLIAALVVVGAIFYNIGISRGVATAANLEGFVFAGGPLSHNRQVCILPALRLRRYANGTSPSWMAADGQVRLWGLG